MNEAADSRIETESAGRAARALTAAGTRYEKPSFEVISLDCEISSYAPDGDDTPLF